MHNLSIIIPHKNSPDLLRRCIDSLPMNDDVQIIIVDDNSDMRIVDFSKFPGMERKNVTCVFDKEGGGAGHARNIGIDIADGKWILFVDADDFLVEQCHDIVCDDFDSDAQIIMYKFLSVSSDTLLPNERYDSVNRMIDEVVTGCLTAKEAVLRKQGPVNKLIKRDYILDNNIRFDNIIASEDVMFMVKAVCLSIKVEVRDKNLYVVTTRNGSLSDKSLTDPKYFLCRFDVYIRRNKFLKAYPEFTKRPIIIQIIRAHRLGFSTMWNALCMAIRQKALFSGFSTIFKKIFKKAPNK